jgi:acyl-CoA thioesterase-2
LGTALSVHPIVPDWSRVFTASLDHALWFHRPFRADEWLLYAEDSPSASGARGFNRGSLFSRDGRLIASVAQEGLIRLRPAPNDKAIVPKF